MQAKRLGEVLLESGLITDDQLRKAVEHHNVHAVKLGTALIELGLIKESVLYDILADQWGVERVPLGLDRLNISFLREFDEFLVRKFKFIPLSYLSEDRRKLKIAVADPLDINAIGAIEKALRCVITTAVATPSAIDTVIKEVYSKEEVIKDLERIAQDVTNNLNAGSFEVVEDENGTPIKQIMNSILKKALEERASDIHISSNGRNVVVKYRIDGVLREDLKLPLSAHASLLSSFKNRAGLDYAEKRIAQDGRSTVRVGEKTIDLRAATIPTVVGAEKLTIRILDKSNLIMDINHLGFSDRNLSIFKQLIHKPEGLILIVGPTGSGKSSTLYTSIINIHDGERNIMTIEDPVEYTLEGIDQTQVNTKVGLTFAAGLRSMLRHDPDIILLGEMRDPETASVGIEAANTGHLVFSTLHTNDAVSTITRLKQMGVQPYQIASSLLGVVSQRLVRRVCLNCIEHYTPTELTPELSFFGLQPSPSLRLARGKGCDKCRDTGYRGRLPIQELLPMDGELRKLVLGDASSDDILAYVRKQGMQLMYEDGISKAKQGLTTLTEIKRKINTGGDAV